MVVVTGVITTDTLYFHFTMSFFSFLLGQWGNFLGSKNIFTYKRESLQYWHF